MAKQERIANRNEFSQVRSDHATEIAEDYVEAIANQIAAKGICRAVDLTTHFSVTAVTVNRTLGRLVRDGWVTTEPYGPVELTTAGKRLANAAKQRHEIVYDFLIALGVNEETARLDSEGIEHHVSAQTLKAMREFSRQQSGRDDR